METKKSESKNLERLKTLFFQIGLVLTMFVTLAAFEWTSSSKKENLLLSGSYVNIDDEIVDITERKQDKPVVITPTTLLSIKPDDAVIPDSVIIEFDPVVPVFTGYTANVQLDDPVIGIEDPVGVAPEMPEFPGGEGALMAYLSSGIKYPAQARDINLQGTVYISFVIEKDGRVSTTKIERGIGGGCDDEALRVVSGMPNWKPGKNSLGRPVRVKLTLPVRFVLRS